MSRDGHRSATRPWRSGPALALALALVLATCLAAAAQAQTEPATDGAIDGVTDPPSDEGAPAPEPPSDVRRLEAARRAFDRGTAYALSEDYSRAAAQFETAFRLVPSADALERAMQSQLRAGHTLRAVNLALRLVGEFPDAEPQASAASAILAEHGASYVRLDLDCETCIFAIEGRVRTFHQVMLEPNTDHRLVVERGDARQEHTLRGAPGERLRVGAPAELVRVLTVEERPPGGSAPSPDPSVDAGTDGLDPWVFGVGVGLTVVAASILVWSGIDTLDGLDAFNHMPTRPAFEEGEAKELRTNVLIVVTSSLAALTLLAALFTRWSPGRAPIALSFAFDASGAMGWVAGRF
ncbi:MAG: tol-pal system YbgF family protein [Sandaracinaceae bacterium]